MTEPSGPLAEPHRAESLFPLPPTSKFHRSIQQTAASVLAAYLRFKLKSQLNLQPAPHDIQLPPPTPGQKYVLYAHVPFCESLCPYCSFNRFLYQEDRARKYFQRLREEMRRVADLGYRFESLYVGGGTPTILPEELAATIDLSKSLFGIQEVSCETNPNHLTDEIISVLAGRVDRLSVGVQSFDDDLLQQMNRYQKFGSGQQILERIQSVAGRLPALNVDMIFNFPTQTEESLRRDVQFVVESGTEQATFYPLMSSPSVERSMQVLGTVDYQREADYYHILSQELSRAFVPMSAWTYSRKGIAMIDEYIVKYDEYVGTGSGSFSYLNGTLYVNTFSLNEYEKALREGRFPITATRAFAKTERMQYRFMMELFDLMLNKKKFRQDFGLPVELGLFKEMLFMSLLGGLRTDGPDFLRLTHQQRYLLVVMMREFFAGVNRVRDQARHALHPSEQLMCQVDNRIIVP